MDAIKRVQSLCWRRRHPLRVSGILSGCPAHDTRQESQKRVVVVRPHSYLTIYPMMVR